MKPTNNYPLEVNDANIDYLTLNHRNHLQHSSDFCMTSLTSSGIGSMKSSTVSVTTGGSPMPCHLVSGAVDTTYREEKWKSKRGSAIKCESTELIKEKSDTKVESSVCKKVIIPSSNDEDALNLTDVEDVDTSGIFSISETSPLKKCKNPSQISLEKEPIIQEDIFEVNRVDSDAYTLNYKYEDAFHAENLGETVPSDIPENNKEILPFHNKNFRDDHVTPMDKVNIEPQNNLMPGKRERLDSDSQNRRKGKLIKIFNCLLTYNL